MSKIPIWEQPLNEQLGLVELIERLNQERRAKIEDDETALCLRWDKPNSTAVSDQTAAISSVPSAQ